MAISFPIAFSGVQSTANPLTKAYAAAVDAGDVLVAFVAIYNAAETCNGVSDSVNGAWTQAYGPINGGNGTRMYGFYKLNSAAGTPTVTANFSNANHHELTISRISGLTGGGVFDQQVSNTAVSTNPSIGPTAALGAANCAAVAGQYNSGVVPTGQGAGWTLDGNLNYGWEQSSFLRQITSSTAALTASWTQGNSFWVGGVMVFRDAGGGTDATAPGATVTGTSGIAAGAATGGSGGSGTFATDPMENNAGSLMANTSVVWEWRKGTGIGVGPTQVVYGSGTTNGAGVLTLTGLPTGAGEALIATPDYVSVCYQRGTVT